MTTALYNNMLKYAKTVMRNIYSNSYLEPMDLVNEAFMNVGAESLETLKKNIVKLAYQDKSYMNARTSYVEYKPKVYRLIETSKTCSRCNNEKGFFDFRVRTDNKNNTSYYSNICRFCSTKSVLAKYHEMKKDPVLYRKFLDDRKTYYINNKDVIKQRVKEYKKNLTPEKKAERSQKRRQAERERIKRIRALPSDDPKLLKFIAMRRRSDDKRMERNRAESQRTKSMELTDQYKIESEQTGIMTNNDKTPESATESEQPLAGWQLLRQKIRNIQNPIELSESPQADTDTKKQRKHEKNVRSWKARYERIKNDPILLKKYKEQSRIKGKKRLEKIHSDPVLLAKYKEENHTRWVTRSERNASKDFTSKPVKTSFVKQKAKPAKRRSYSNSILSVLVNKTPKDKK